MNSAFTATGRVPNFAIAAFTSENTRESPSIMRWPSIFESMNTVN
jgi:hypothetical protein